MSHATLRTVLLAILVLGAVGSISPGTTYSLFSNTHDGTGTVNATNNINSNSGGTTADSGGPYSVVEGGSVQLDGSGSTTQNGNIDSYAWQITTSAGGDSLSGSGAQVTYNAPADVSSDTTAEVELTVTTNQGATDTDTATVTVTDADGCGAASLSFCSVDINDRDTSYAVTYAVDDPDGNFDRVQVTLNRTNNRQTEDIENGTATAGTLSVSDNGNMNQAYTVRVGLYDTSGTRVACRIAENDQSDGTDPSVSEC